MDGNRSFFGRGLEDLLCGVIGYTIGKSKHSEVSEQECENIIRGFLRQVSLEDLIDYWMKDNGFTGGCEGYVCNKLRDKADRIEENL